MSKLGNDIIKKYDFTFNSDGWLSSCLLPKRIGTCCECKSILWAEFSEWEQHEETDLYLPTDTMMYVHCYENKFHDLTQGMPYVYYFPMQQSAHAWVIKALQIIFNLEPPTHQEKELYGQQSFLQLEGN